MANLVRFPGCTLDIADNSYENLSSLGRLGERINKNNYEVGKSITRLVAISTPSTGMGNHSDIYRKGIDYFLAQTEEYFKLIASSIGASVLPFSWKLIPIEKDHSYPDLNRNFGIPNHTLGAEIEVLPGKKLSADSDGQQYWDINTRLKTIGHEFLEENGWWVADSTSPHQFTATANELQTDTKSLTLHDIEPRAVSYI